MHNSSSLIHKSSSLIHNSSSLIHNSSLFTHDGHPVHENRPRRQTRAARHLRPAAGSRATRQIRAARRLRPAAGGRATRQTRAARHLRPAERTGSCLWTRQMKRIRATTASNLSGSLPGNHIEVGIGLSVYMYIFRPKWWFFSREWFYSRDLLELGPRRRPTKVIIFRWKNLQFSSEEIIGESSFPILKNLHFFYVKTDIVGRSETFQQLFAFRSYELHPSTYVWDHRFS